MRSIDVISADAGNFSVEGKVRTPTWSGLFPSLPILRYTVDKDSEELRQELSLEGDLYILDFGNGPSRMFCLRKATEDFFIKIYTSKMASVGYRSEVLANWIAERSELTSASKTGFPRRLRNGDLVCMRPYCKGNRMSATVVNMERLGGAIAKLHGLLSFHPDRVKWLGQTDQRLSAIEKTREEIVGKTLKVGPNPILLAQVATTSNLSFRPSEMTRIPLHGDLNPGNILMYKGDPKIFDLEDVEHSVLDSCFELALVIERIVMVAKDISDAKRVEVGRAFMRGYRGAGGILSVPEGLLLADVPRVLALRSLCLLAHAEQEGVSMPEVEWAKFFSLFDRATQMATLWDDVFAA